MAHTVLPEKIQRNLLNWRWIDAIHSWRARCSAQIADPSLSTQGGLDARSWYRLRPHCGSNYQRRIHALLRDHGPGVLALPARGAPDCGLFILCGEGRRNTLAIPRSEERRV